jgi:hypothetical protein
MKLCRPVVAHASACRGELQFTVWSFEIYYMGRLIWWGSPMGCGGVTRRLRRILKNGLKALSRLKPGPTWGGF